MERRVHANGWGAMEAATEQGVLNVCRNQESSVPVSYDQRALILILVKLGLLSFGVVT